MPRFRDICSLDPKTGEPVVVRVQFTPEEEATATAQVPHASVVSRRQFKLGLHAWGLTEVAQAAAEAAGGTTLISWTETGSFSITDPALVTIVTSLGKIDLLQEFFDDCATL